MNNPNPTIAILPPDNQQPNAWSPIIGEETISLMTNIQIPNDDKVQLQQESVRILSRCSHPASPANSRTGLVIGYVQSGKTMSFTTVTALARDNSYQMVIVIAGTSIPLSSQSRDRIRRDFRLNSRPDRKWQHFHNPTIPGSTALEYIRNILSDWDDPNVQPSQRQCILITVMKNHAHLNNLISLVQQLALTNRPVLVIDDEADQAGLNNLVQIGQQSTTYQCLVTLRQSLPHHSFIQYTATPQAPLLINLIDILSPDFAEILTAGPAYVGGQDFFLNQSQLVRDIPLPDIPTQRNPITVPPDSLAESMRYFFLGVAAGSLLDNEVGNRSMLVHPSQLRTSHGQYFAWVQSIKNNWMQILQLRDNDPDKLELLDSFRPAFGDLQNTVGNLPSFEQLAAALLRSIRLTRIEEVNSRRGRTPQIDWYATYSHILVGGQAMDRGFTVEGLTVTYMPRNIGVGNADTVQQRARFFGYKRAYMGFCRIFLEPNAHVVYTSYVEHEEDVRSRLIDFRGTALPLQEWKRAFFLDLALRPTRKSVLDLDYIRGDYSDNWFVHDAPIDSIDASNSNRRLVDLFISRLPFTVSAGHSARTPDMTHGVVQAALSFVFTDLLTNVRVTRADDSQKYIGLLLQIENFLSINPQEQCVIYNMSQGASRRRRIDQTGTVAQLFQGANTPTNNYRKGEVYAGDREIHGSASLTIQIHNLDIGPDANTIIARNIPCLAIWVPAKMSTSWLVQNQPST